MPVGAPKDEWQSSLQTAGKNGPTGQDTVSERLSCIRDHDMPSVKVDVRADDVECALGWPTTG